MELEVPRLDFASFRGRLLDAVRYRLRNGEWTERGLARRMGVSQPHIHNVLKGKRELTPQVADILLRSLNMSLLELVRQEEMWRTLSAGEVRGTRLVGVAEGVLGPWRPWPDLEAAEAQVRVVSEDLEGVVSPVLVELGADVGLGRGTAGGMALLDRKVPALGFPDPNGVYAIQWKGAGCVRRVRVERSGLRMLGQMELTPAAIPEVVTAGVGMWREVVKAKVVWVGENLGPARRLRECGSYLRAALQRTG